MKYVCMDGWMDDEMNRYTFSSDIDLQWILRLLLLEQLIFHQDSWYLWKTKQIMY